MRTIETREKSQVVFLSPGTFVSEQSERDVESWDVEAATQTASNITERHGAIPYGFYFRKVEGFHADGRWTTLKELDRSPMYYINGVVETRSQVEARADPGESILVSNMRYNGIERVVTTKNGFKHVAEFKDGDQIVRL